MRAVLILLLLIGPVCAQSALPRKLRALGRAGVLRGAGADWRVVYDWGPGPSVGLLAERRMPTEDWILAVVGRLSRRPPSGRLVVGESGGLAKESLDGVLVPLATPRLNGGCAVPPPLDTRLEVIEATADHTVLGEAALALQSEMFNGVEDAQLHLERFTPTGALFSLKSYDREGREAALTHLQELLKDAKLSYGETRPTAAANSWPRRLRQALVKEYGPERVAAQPPYEDSVLYQPSWTKLTVPATLLWLTTRHKDSPHMLERALRELLRVNR